MKKGIPILAAVVVVLIAGVCFYQNHKPLPLPFSAVDRIELYENKGVGDSAVTGDSVLVIQERNDIESILRIHKEAKGGWREEYPGCPFGLQMVIYEGGQKHFIDVGTDACGKLVYNNRYYQLSEHAYDDFEKLLAEHGVDLHYYI